MQNHHHYKAQGIGNNTFYVVIFIRKNSGIIFSEPKKAKIYVTSNMLTTQAHQDYLYHAVKESKGYADSYGVPKVQYNSIEDIIKGKMWRQ